MTIHTSGENVMTYNRNRLNDISKENLDTIAYLSLNGISTSFNENQKVNKRVYGLQIPIKTVSVVTLRNKSQSLRIENVDLFSDIDLKQIISDKTDPALHPKKLTSEYIDNKLKYLYMLKYLMTVDYIKYKAEYNKWPKPAEDVDKYQKLLVSAINYQELIDGQNYLTSPLISDYIKAERTKYKRYIYYLRKLNSLLKM